MRKMKTVLIALMPFALALIPGTIFAQNPDPYAPDFSAPKAIPGMTLVWNDEFNTNGKPDPASWGYESGFVRNEELQWYSPANAYCLNGVLVLEGRREKFKNPNYVEGSKDWKLNREYADYTSASINTRGLRQWQFGRFEIRAKIDVTPGEWIDIWTMGAKHAWPASGEIDIAEFHGKEIRANVIWAGNTFKGMGMHSVNKLVSDLVAADPDWSKKFHVWRMDWDSAAIKLYLDDTLLETTMISQAANQDGTNGFLQPHYILLSNALGVYGGDPSKSEFPIRFEIDYVRVYQPTAGANANSELPQSIGIPKSAASDAKAAPLAVTPAAGSLLLDGKWRVHSSIAGNETDADCTFTRMNNDLAGFCGVTQGDAKITGKVDGEKVIWSYNVDYNGSKLTMKYEGTLDAGKINGAVTVAPFGVGGNFTATQLAASENLPKK